MRALCAFSSPSPRIALIGVSVCRCCIGRHRSRRRRSRRRLLSRRMRLCSLRRRAE